MNHVFVDQEKNINIAVVLYRIKIKEIKNIKVNKTEVAKKFLDLNI